MTIKELNRNLALFPDSLEVKIQCNNFEHNLTRVTCCYPPQAKQYAVLFAENETGLNENCLIYHTNGRCNDDPEPVVTPEMKQRAQETATKFSFDRR